MKLLPFPTYLRKEQLSALKKLAKENHQSVAKEIRDAIDEHLLATQKAIVKQSKKELSS